MGLKTTWGDANKVVQTALAVRYTVTQDSVKVSEWVKANPDDAESTLQLYKTYDKPFYRCRRRATKRYSYVGMTEAAAEACAAAKVAQYTRDCFVISITESEDTDLMGNNPTVIGTKTTKTCTSDISAERDEGGMWHVTVSVSEDDEKPSLTSPADVASLFAAENARNYD